MPTLYVTEPGSRIEKEYRRLLVTLEDEVLLSIALSRVDEVVLVGSVGATTPALLALLEQGVALTFITPGGRLLGRLEPAQQPNLALRHRQYTCTQDASFCLEISRRIVIAKIKNSRTCLRRMLLSRRQQLDARESEPAVLRLNGLLRDAQQAATLAELRGVEGLAARQYFAMLRQALHPDFFFEKRTRRPPKDPANALLSLSYTLLTQAAFSACRIVGLDAYDGFYHADKYGRPALALDLVEEFRALVADSVVLTLVNNRRLQPDDFQSAAGQEPGVYLSRRGWRLFLRAFSRRLQAAVHHPQAGRALSYQKIFEVQARLLRKCIESGVPDYQPYLGK